MPEPRVSALRPHSVWTVSAWVGLIVGLSCLVVWLGVPLSAEPEAARCQRPPGVWRGVYHIHPVGHDDRDRTSRMMQAAQASCLDFLVVTNHQALAWQGLDEHPSGAAPVVLDGAEWTVSYKHHEGQLAGALNGPTSPEVAAYRVLNHPSWSGFATFADLPATTVEQLAAGDMAIEVLNAPRLLRQAQDAWALLLAAASGLGRTDLFLGALALPGRDRTLWLEAQAKLGRAIPMVCGSDAHGGTSDFYALFPATVLYVERPSDDGRPPFTADALVAALRDGRVACVNELFGSPGPIALRDVAGEVCMLDVDASLDAQAHWRVLRDGEELARGRTPTRVRLPGAGVYHLELWRRWDFGLLGRHERLWAIGRGVVRGAGCVEGSSAP